ncbi:hypothetical protein N7454_009230 [Penicillium verhagenii]|nr:hypothetical protein N7454_009230 [Penicillium verhagenii]
MAIASPGGGLVLHMSLLAGSSQCQTISGDLQVHKHPLRPMELQGTRWKARKANHHRNSSMDQLTTSEGKVYHMPSCFIMSRGATAKLI